MLIVATMLFTLYLGLSPVTWWPGISPGLMDALKFSLIGISVTLIWVSAGLSGGFQFPRSWLGPIGFVLVLFASAAGIAQAPVHESLLRIKDFTLSFVMLWTFFMYSRLGRDADRIFFGAALIVAVHAALVTTSWLVGFPSWSGPKQYFATSALWVSGFAPLRTGWSNGVALFAPILGAHAVSLGRKALIRIAAALSLVVVVASQVIVGGRAGLLASLIGLGIVVARRRYRKWLVIYVALIAITASAMAGYLYVHMRLEDLSQNGSLVTRLNEASSGRLDVDVHALELAAKRPFTGYGFGTINFQGVQIHNLWLRMLVDAGVFFPLVFALVVVTIFRRAAAVRRVRRRFKDGHWRTSSRLFRQFDDRYFVYRAVLISGLVISMFEPAYLLGAFQNSALWWAVVGAGLVLPKDGTLLAEGAAG